MNINPLDFKLLFLSYFNSYNYQNFNGEISPAFKYITAKSSFNIGLNNLIEDEK